MSKTTIEILKEARELIAKPNGWTQGTYARNADGLIVYPNSHHAVCFCTWGALIAVDEHQESFQPDGAQPALDDVTNGNFVAFNDAPGRTQAEVVAKFDEAIAAEEAKEAV